MCIRRMYHSAPGCANLHEFLGLDEMAGFLFVKMGVYSRKNAVTFTAEELPLETEFIYLSPVNVCTESY